MKINFDIILYIAAACVGIGSSLADELFDVHRHHSNTVVQPRRMLISKDEVSHKLQYVTYYLCVLQSKSILIAMLISYVYNSFL